MSFAAFVIFTLKFSASRFGVFDLDAYGCAWGLLYHVLERAGKGPITVFLTDGLLERMRRNSKASKIAWAVNRIPKGMEIPGSPRWYEPIFKTMLLDVESRYGWRTARGMFGYNARPTVCYWGLELERMGPKRAM